MANQRRGVSDVADEWMGGEWGEGSLTGPDVWREPVLRWIVPPVTWMDGGGRRWWWGGCGGRGSGGGA